MAAGAAGMTGLGAIVLTGCGDDDDDTKPGENGGATGTATPAAGSTGTAVAAPKRGGTWKTFTGSAAGLPSALDIHRTVDPNVGQGLWQWAANLLLRYDPQQDKVQADLAAALPEITDDGQTFIFKINPAAKWQNRKPAMGGRFDSEDVKYTFERIKDPATASPRGGNYRDVTSITTPDPRTVVFKLAAPKADFPAILADQYDMIQPKEFAGQKDPITDAASVIGSGPYELVSYAVDQGWTMRRRADGYWKPNTAWLDGWDLKRLDDPEAARAGFKNGQAHINTIPFDQRDAYKKDGFQVLEFLATSKYVFWMNHKKEPYTDPKVRKAVSLAIDRVRFIDLAQAGAGVISGPMTAAAKSWALPESELVKLPGFGTSHDAAIKEAKALLSSAGLPNGFSDSAMTVALFQPGTEVLVAMLKEIGVNLSVTSVGSDLTTWQTRLREHNFTSALGAHTSGPYPDAQLGLYLATFEKGGTRNYADYSNPAVDDLLARQSRTVAAAERKPLVLEAQRLALQDPGAAWLSTGKSSFAAQAYVRDIRTSATGANWPMYTAEEAWLAQ